jgi:hypothetical protein
MNYLYEILERLSLLLETDIYGRTVKEWLKLALAYSFVLWLGIVLYNSYNAFTQFKEVSQKVERKQAILKRKEREYKRQKAFLADLNRGYSELAKVITPIKKATILKVIAHKIEKELHKTSTTENIFATPQTPMVLRAINVKVASENVLSQIKVFNLGNLPTAPYALPPAVARVGNTYMAKAEKTSTINLSAKADFRDDYIILLLAPDKKGGYIKLFADYDTPFAPNLWLFRKNFSFIAKPFQRVGDNSKSSMLIISWFLTR